MSDCRKCAEFSWCLENEDCGLFKQKPQTNADRIRAMTDEELAKLGDRWCDCSLDNCPIYDSCFPSKRLSCYDTFLSWLKAEEGEE